VPVLYIASQNINLTDYIRQIDDYPKPDIVFYDITTLLGNAQAFDFAIEKLAKKICTFNIDKIIGLEARGFIFAAALALKLKKPLVLVRKAGKLPNTTIAESYELEYGHNTLEIHTDSLLPGENVAIIDDVLATGGTMRAACRLVERLDANVMLITSIIALPHLGFAEKLSAYEHYYLVEYP